MLPCSTRQTIEVRPQADKKARRADAEAWARAFEAALAAAEAEGLDDEAAKQMAGKAAKEAAAAAREEAYAAAVAGDPGQPLYLLAVPSELDKIEITAAVLAAGVKPVTQQMIRASLRRLIGHYAAPDSVARLIEALDRLDAEQASSEDIALIGEAESLVMADEAYARLAAMQVKWTPYLRWHAARRLLRGWSNVPATYGTGRDGLVSEQALAQVPAAHLEALGSKAISLLTTDEDEAGN